MRNKGLRLLSCVRRKDYGNVTINIGILIKNTNISIDILVGMIYNHKVPTLKGGQQNVNREIHQ